MGEPLQAARSALLLPRDVLETDLGACFVRVEAPKTCGRGRGRVQHFVCKDVAFVGFLDKLFGDLPPQALL